MKVKNYSNLEKNEVTGVIINTDRDSYEAYLQQRDNILADKERISSLEAELFDIKTLLKALLESKDGNN